MMSETYQLASEMEYELQEASMGPKHMTQSKPFMPAIQCITTQLKYVVTLNKCSKHFTVGIVFV